MPGTVSANSRKLREICGMVWIWRSEMVLPTSEVFTSCNAVAVTDTPLSVVAVAAEGAPAATGCGWPRSSVAVEATERVTVRSVPGPASTW